MGREERKGAEREDSGYLKEVVAVEVEMVVFQVAGSKEVNEEDALYHEFQVSNLLFQLGK